MNFSPTDRVDTDFSTSPNAVLPIVGRVPGGTRPSYRVLLPTGRTLPCPSRYREVATSCKVPRPRYCLVCGACGSFSQCQTDNWSRRWTATGGQGGEGHGEGLGTYKAPNDKRRKGADGWLRACEGRGGDGAVKSGRGLSVSLDTLVTPRGY